MPLDAYLLLGFGGGYMLGLATGYLFGMSGFLHKRFLKEKKSKESS
jgi:hypothetical protein